MIKCFAVLTILLIAAGCGGGTSAVTPPSPVQSTGLKGSLTGDLTLSGDVTGKMTLTSDSRCYLAAQPDPDHRFELDFRGTLALKTWALIVDSVANAPEPSVVDAGLGLSTDSVSTYLSHPGDGTQSSVTVGQDMRSGTMSLQLKPEAANRLKGQVNVTATFSCSFP